VVVSKNNQAVIYEEDNKFNSCSESGYLIELSDDYGRNWYYTGITVNKKFYFKCN
jgi:hypothetical protein